MRRRPWQARHVGEDLGDAATLLTAGVQAAHARGLALPRCRQSVIKATVGSTEKRAMLLWLSSDARRLPLKIEIELAVEQLHDRPARG